MARAGHRGARDVRRLHRVPPLVQRLEGRGHLVAARAGAQRASDGGAPQSGCDAGLGRVARIERSDGAERGNRRVSECVVDALAHA